MRALRVAVVLDQEIQGGGGYQQAVNAALLVEKLPRTLVEPVFFATRGSSVAALNTLGIPAAHLRVSLPARALAAVEEAWPKLHAFCRALDGGHGVETQLRRCGADLVYFLSPCPLARHLDTLNYVVTVWDLCHRDDPEFPEVRRARTFEQRERAYWSMLPKATAVIVDSELGRENAVRRYGLDADRVHVLPFSPASSQLAPAGADRAAPDDIARKYGLPERYVFYPAQFWSHKNHVYLLEGLNSLERMTGQKLGAVFAGGDKGNLAFVKHRAAELGLAERVRFLGFVPNQDMPLLYQGAVALVMPTYFGPTNLPPLEAFALSVPVVYPDKAGLREQVGGAALLMDLDDPESMARQLAQLMARPDLRARLVAAGREKLGQHGDEDRLRTLHTIFSRFLRRRAAWA